MYQYDAFYDACDELGLLVLQDAMFSKGASGHSPPCCGTGCSNQCDDAHCPIGCDPLRNNRTRSTMAELVHQMRRLSSHPSIVAWDACNECEGQGFYASFVMTTIAAEDPSRAIWPASPAAGWESGVDALTSFPLPGVPLVPKPCPFHPAKGEACLGPHEVHGPYLVGDGFHTRRQPFAWPDDRLSLFAPLTLPHFTPGSIDPSVRVNQSGPCPVGVNETGWFVSEFGATSFSSYESHAPTLSHEQPDHRSLHAPPFVERSWPADSIIKSYFGVKQVLPTPTPSAAPPLPHTQAAVEGGGCCVQAGDETCHACERHVCAWMPTIGRVGPGCC